MSMARMVDSVRTALANDPASYTFAKFPAGTTQGAAELPECLRELLKITDGARAGEVALYKAATISQGQHYCDGLDGGRTKWLCFAINLDYPLFIERATGAVWWIPEMNLEYFFMSDRFERLADSVEDFFAEYIFGEGYRRLTDSGESDPWYRFLRNGVIE